MRLQRIYHYITITIYTLNKNLYTNFLYYTLHFSSNINLIVTLFKVITIALSINIYIINFKSEEILHLEIKTIWLSSNCLLKGKV